MVHGLLIAKIPIRMMTKDNFHEYIIELGRLEVVEKKEKEIEKKYQTSLSFSWEDVALINMIRTAWIHLSLKVEGCIENIIVQGLLQRSIDTSGSCQHHTGPYTVALNSLKGVSDRRTGH